MNVNLALALSDWRIKREAKMAAALPIQRFNDSTLQRLRSNGQTFHYVVTASLIPSADHLGRMITKC